MRMRLNRPVPRITERSTLQPCHTRALQRQTLSVSPPAFQRVTEGLVELQVDDLEEGTAPCAVAFDIGLPYEPTGVRFIHVEYGEQCNGSAMDEIRSAALSRRRVDPINVRPNRARQLNTGQSPSIRLDASLLAEPQA